MPLATSVMAGIGKLRTIFVSEDYRQFLFLFIAMLSASALQVTGIASIVPFMQLISQPGIIAENEWLQWIYVSFGFQSEREMLLWSGVSVFFLFAGSVVVNEFMRWLIQRSIWATAHRLCVRQLRIYMQLPYEFFLVNNSTELLRRIVEDINKLLTDVLLAGSMLLAQATLAIGLLLLLLMIDPVLSLLAFFAFGSTYLLLHWLRHSYLVKLGHERIETDHRRYTAFIDAMTGIKTIQVTETTGFFLDRFAEASLQYSQIPPRLTLVTNLPRMVMEILAFGGILITVLIYVAVTEDFLTAVPTLSVFALATYRLMPALHTVFESAARLSNSLPVIDSVARDMQGVPVRQASTEHPPQTLPFNQEIRLTSQSFRYASASQAALSGVEIVVKKGTSVALVGSTGSGKTTSVDIIVGLLMPEASTLRVDGTVIDADHLSVWRSLIAYVPQDVFLYDESIASNIAFGASAADIDQERLRWAARIAQIDTFIDNELADGFATHIGERGVRLSGGQRQRLGLARAIYRKPQVLVLDEATSALDNLTEKTLMAAIREALPGVTLITIAHRLSTVRSCDRIYLLEAGTVAAEGSYEELYRDSQLFRAMVDAVVSEN